MQNLEDLAAYGMVVKHRGFTAAARVMHTSKSALSKRVARLEERLGVRLIERSSRGFRVTAIGAEVATHAETVIASVEEAERAAQLLTSAPRGAIRIACPPGLLHTALADALSQFALRYPDIRVAVTVSNRRVDLVEEPFDLAIRARERLDSESGLVVRKLGVSRRILVAAPDYLKGRPAISVPADLQNEQLLTLAEDGAESEWMLMRENGERHVVEFMPRFAATDFGLLNRAALAGVGIALVTEAIAGPFITSGRVMHVLPDWHASESVVHIAFTTRRGMLPATRALIEFLAAEAPARF
ncbi:LysR family transcriptional regulator [Cupriavidus cauae]|uniref:LysR family transcriptional regulator n=1 Tax=Cupriavidus cauae TaxID=2608999 RepID=A0A5M8BDM0_9BURK|nr:LysR family transcriptional regulator [Cupriavidus cauae]KAA6133473.1 LysR family transcriptional regulator [Cupriavidus cauae]